MAGKEPAVAHRLSLNLFLALDDLTSRPNNEYISQFFLICLK